MTMITNNNNNSNKDKEDDGKKFFRICDCTTGFFVTSITKAQIDYIYEVVVRANMKTGDFVHDFVADSAINTLSELKNYLTSGVRT
jgi:hypothetical protein